MNNKYIEELFEENKQIFADSGLDIESPEDLKDLMLSYIVTNMQYDFNIDVNISELFKGGE